MKIKIGFKKILSSLGLLTIATPISLSVVACAWNETDSEETENIINNINKITDLKIDISINENDATVFHVLNHDEIGLTIRLAKHHEIKNFDKNLFQLDTNNIYFDRDGKQKVLKDTKVEKRKYYFQFSYNNQNNNTLVPVEIINTEEEIVQAISETSYQIGVWSGSTVEDFKTMIDNNFIKNQLQDSLQDKYRHLFILNEVTINGEAIKAEDLIEIGEIETIINYDYGSFKNQRINLMITKKLIPDIKPEQFIAIAKERANTSPMIFTIKTFDDSYDYLPEVKKEMAKQIYDEYLNTYKVKVDVSKLQMEKIISNLMVPKTIDNKWFLKAKRFIAIGSCAYDHLSTGPLKIMFNIVDEK